MSAVLTEASHKVTDDVHVLSGPSRLEAVRTLEQRHYTRSVPSGKSYYMAYKTALCVWAIPANPYVSRWLVGRDKVVWELSRLWAPDAHAPNLLSETIARAVAVLRQYQPEVEALVSYADPNVGHEGYVYRACGWQFLGQSEETRAYRNVSGEIVARRAFHSGRNHLTKAEILARGFSELKLPGKYRYARGLTRRARAQISGLAHNLGVLL